MSDQIRVKAQQIIFSPEELRDMKQAFGDVLESGFVSDGPACALFGEQNAQMVGSGFGLAVNNGTAAIEVALRALAPKGRVVLVPTNTATPTALAVLHAGYKIRWIDTDDDHQCPNVSLKTIQKAYEADKLDVAGVIVVHIGGVPVLNMAEILAWTKMKNLALIEDCAHAHGVYVQGQHVGSFGDAATFSYYATKVLNIGEGGAVVFRDQAVWEKARCLVNQGKTRGSIHTYTGNNWRMPEPLAAAAYHLMKRRNEIFDERAGIAQLYYNTISLPSDCEWIMPPEKSSFYKFLIYMPEHRAKVFEARMLALGVKLPQGVYTLPVHQQELFQSEEGRAHLSYTQTKLPNAEAFARNHVALPLYKGMSHEAMNIVTQASNKALEDL